MRAGGLLAGALLDVLLGDPRRGHPVALFGAAAQRVEGVLYRDDRAAGSPTRRCSSRCPRRRRGCWSGGPGAARAGSSRC